MHILSPLLIELILLAPPQAASARVIDPAWAARIRSEVPDIITRYTKLSACLEETSTIRYEKVRAADSPTFANRTLKVIASRLDDNLLVKIVTLVDGDEKSSGVRLSCKNVDYRFELTAKGEDRPYVLRNYKPRELAMADDPPPVIVSNVMGELRFVLDAVENRNHVSAKALSWDDRKKLLRVQFERTIDTPNKTVHIDNEFWLDPSAGWRIVETTKTGPASVVHTTSTYGQVIDGLHFPTRSEEMHTYSGKNARPPLRVGITTSVNKSTKSPSDFRLSAYEIPEPAGLQSTKPTPRYTWFLIAAGGFAVLTVLLRWLVRRRQPAPTTAT
jgi:hypothetical protein